MLMLSKVAMQQLTYCGLQLSIIHIQAGYILCRDELNITVSTV